MRQKALWLILIVMIMAFGFAGCGGDDTEIDTDGDNDTTDGDDIADGDDVIPDGDNTDCIPQCNAKECGLDGCGGVCGVCNQPPAPQCISDLVLRSFNNTGDCVENLCTYGHVDSQCEEGCVEGACIGCQPNCNARECGNDGCGGSCGICNQAPAPECVTPYEVRVYDSTGDCVAEGTCQYGFTNTPCEFGCQDGACQGCTVNCSGKECGSDGCGGNCGSCSQPPAPECVTENTLRVYDRAGACVTGTCNYDWTNITCDYNCADGACQECVPNCENKECGNDGCDGSCGFCNQPPAPECAGDTQIKEYSPSGTCETGTCNYEFTLTDCQFGCNQETNTCNNCTPDCNGKECGRDGCGGTCGACDADLEYCTDAGLCVCQFNACAEMCCPQADVCTDNMCCTPDAQCPETVECGAWTDDCEVDHNCGSCLNGYSCLENACECINDRVVCNEVCCDDDAVCFNNECCQPDCDGKVCGDDGCGGSCGMCDLNEQCNESGQCFCPNTECNGNCCGSADDVCYNNACCTPATACPNDVECGTWTDSCGVQHDCGTCDNGYSCEANACVCPAPQVECDGVCCDSGSVCFENACCAPACDGKTCGDDSCGGSCGTCQNGYVCDTGICDCPDPRVECDGTCCVTDDLCTDNTCCTPATTCLETLECGTWTDPCSDTEFTDCGTCDTQGDVCFENMCCTPACDGKTCGDNSCGGNCGTCDTEGDVCYQDNCCTPDCDGKVCGDNTCGGSCGDCGAGTHCDTGACVPD